MIFLKLIEKHLFSFTKSPFFLIGLLLFFFACKSINNSEENDKKNFSPNFILILADDQGWNGTSVQMMHNEPGSKSDYFETPNLELLAQRGMRFFLMHIQVHQFVLPLDIAFSLEKHQPGFH